MSQDEESTRKKWRTNQQSSTPIDVLPEDETTVQEAQLRQKAITQARELERERSAAEDYKAKKALAAKRRAENQSGGVMSTKIYISNEIA